MSSGAAGAEIDQPINRRRVRHKLRDVATQVGARNRWQVLKVGRNRTVTPIEGHIGLALLDEFPAPRRQLAGTPTNLSRLRLALELEHLRDIESGQAVAALVAENRRLRMLPQKLQHPSSLVCQRWIALRIGAHFSIHSRVHLSADSSAALRVSASRICRARC